MLETLFTMILAGCGDAGGACTVLDEVKIPAATLEICEAQLDERLAALPAGWPEVAGLCIPPGQLVALPAGWQRPEIFVAAAE